MDKDTLVETGRVLGKREMLLYLQKACAANGGTLTMDDINKYSQVCAVDEMIWNDNIVECEMELDRDIRQCSLSYAQEAP